MRSQKYFNFIDFIILKLAKNECKQKNVMLQLIPCKIKTYAT